MKIKFAKELHKQILWRAENMNAKIVLEDLTLEELYAIYLKERTY